MTIEEAIAHLTVLESWATENLHKDMQAARVLLFEVKRLRAVYVAAKVYCDLNDASTETAWKEATLLALRQAIEAAEKGGE